MCLYVTLCVAENSPRCHDRSMIAIDTIALENEAADNMYQLVLSGNLERYLQGPCEHRLED